MTLTFIMRNRILALLLLVLFPLGLKAATSSDLVLVQGGTFKNAHSNYYGSGVRVHSFYIGRDLVTQREWKEVMPTNPSHFQGDNLPVESISWYDAVEYCNRRSLREGLQPYYRIDKQHVDANTLPDPKFGQLDTVRWTVTVNARANGYRLPTDVEWEYAASGGQQSHGYIYSGSNNVDDVAWYWKNSGDKPLDGYWYWPKLQANHNRTQPVGRKLPNELGLYDMSGNVREWCWDRMGDFTPVRSTVPEHAQGYQRVWRGGGWIGADFCCASSYRGGLAANGSGPDQGLRICRNA